MGSVERHVPVGSSRVPEGVKAITHWTINGVIVNKSEDGSIELDVLDCSEIGPDIIKTNLCESTTPTFLQLHILDSGVETTLQWQIEVRLWSPPTSVLEDALALGEAYWPAITGVISIGVLALCSVMFFSRRRQAVLDEAILSYGAPQSDEYSKLDNNRKVPAAPNFKSKR